MIFPEHELKVGYPLGGEHVCLVWNTRNQGNHIILARTLFAVEQVFKRVLDKHGSVVVKSVESLQVVAPPASVCEAYVAEMLARERSVFWDVCGAYADGYEARNGRLPRGIEWCTASDEEYHSQECQCGGSTIMPVQGTLESEFLKHRAAYLKRHPSYVDKTRKVSQAGPADPTKPLYVTTGNFGPHCTGLEMNQDMSGLSLSPVLFFYQDPVPMRVAMNGFEEAVRAEQRKEKQRLIDRDRSWKEKRQQRQREEDKELEEYFGV